MVTCPKCGAPFKRVYPNAEIDNLNDMAQYNLARTVQCTNDDCAFVWQLSPFEILAHFFTMRKDQGYTVNDAAKELEEEYKREKREGLFDK